VGEQSNFPTPERRIAAFLHNNSMPYARVHGIRYEGEDMIVLCSTRHDPSAKRKPWTVRLRDRPTYRNKDEIDPAPDIIGREEGFVA
jgi:uncharacterized protein (UPF0248 family)